MPVFLKSAHAVFFVLAHPPPLLRIQMHSELVKPYLNSVVSEKLDPSMVAVNSEFLETIV
ncbi:hypothetical protein FVEN_g12707 [Fusarium venenatum]|uniref:Uncharacterized protein n=1 Tax=Fusarium venenatum TaxID=56646 RepID=A0A2L2TBX6_9HYPO|nr:uncharacterized protein FVRRES_06283 [Fusarium venenatum]KAG8359418.1 hypothetical protein FVEN_g12707 [Fusarium venenatum]CEI61847.1 unnamed protein product [Fusarium venenatum]